IRLDYSNLSGSTNPSPSYTETVEKIVYIDFDVENLSSQTIHLVAIWVINGSQHQRFDASTTPSFDHYLSPGESKTIRFYYEWEEGVTYTFKLVTERGRIFITSATATMD
ncbi:hypothetical protein DRO53_00945, partial [Candidatus Bathyarchaeota archaeon]